MTPPRRAGAAGATARRMACILLCLAAGVVVPHAQLRRDRARAPQAKECVDCHDEEVKRYGKFSSPHAPAASGDCEACHLRHGIVGVLRLRAADPEICLTCHARVGDDATGRGTGTGRTPAAEGRHRFTHPPGADMKCGTCHAPHGSSRAHALAEPVPVPGRTEGEAPADCLRCHPAQGEPGVTRHPKRIDCLSCHDPHGSEIGANLSAPRDALCAACHDGTAAGEKRAHGGAVPPASSCLDCHTPHTSAGAALLRRHVHPPLEDGCDSCHSGTPANPFALVETGAALCLSCHDDPAGAAAAHGEGSRTHVPVAEGNCLACHAPHAADQAALLKGPLPVVCGTCHVEAEQAREAAAPHPPATEDCSACHLAHAGPANLLRNPSIADLCATCHDGIGAEVGRAHPHEPAAAGDCLTCHAPHGSAQPGCLTRPQSALCGDCHDMTEHLEARVRHVPVVQGRCTACHEPHGATSAHLVVDALADACLECHASTRADRERPAQHPPFAAGDCLSCHAPHSAPRRALLVTHPSRLCLDCHDDVGVPEGGSTHLPVQRGECLACHAPHAGHEPGMLTLADTRLLCSTCHESLDRGVVGRSASVHAPFRDDSCLTCHTAHGSPRDALLVEAPPALCRNCHDTEDPELKAPHRGLLDADTDCSGCHEPHVSEVEKLLVADRHEPFREGDCGACHRGETP